MQNPIYVTQPNLPPLEEFVPYLQQIWDNKTLINGTIALVTALQALRVTGEVITTPYVGLICGAPAWSGNDVVCMDVDPINIDYLKVGILMLWAPRRQPQRCKGLLELCT